jgi:predicted flap endonuclease-1-like 5' DNA nuclease
LLDFFVALQHILAVQQGRAAESLRGATRRSTMTTASPFTPPAFLTPEALLAPAKSAAERVKSGMDLWMSWSCSRAETRVEKRAKVASQLAKTVQGDTPVPSHAADLAATYAVDAMQSAILAWYGWRSGRVLPESDAPTPAVLFMEQAAEAGRSAMAIWFSDNPPLLFKSAAKTAPALTLVPPSLAPKAKAAKAKAPAKPKPALTVISPPALEPDPAPAAEVAAPVAIAAAPPVDIMAEAPAVPVVEAVVETVVEAVAAPAVLAEPSPTIIAGQPLLLDAPRGGKADDLSSIKGIGPKILDLLSSLGIYHFDQIAAWTPDDIAWIEAKLDFRGRVTREKWVEQAKAKLS